MFETLATRGVGRMSARRATGRCREAVAGRDPTKLVDALAKRLNADPPLTPEAVAASAA